MSDCKEIRIKMFARIAKVSKNGKLVVGLCQTDKVAALDCVRIGKCQSRISEIMA